MKGYRIVIIMIAFSLILVSCQDSICNRTVLKEFKSSELAIKTIGVMDLTAIVKDKTYENYEWIFTEEKEDGCVVWLKVDEDGIETFTEYIFFISNEDGKIFGMTDRARDVLALFSDQ